MNRQPPTEMSVPITLESYQRLVGASIRGGFKLEYWEIAAIAIQEWLVRHSPDVFPTTVAAGYQWKHVFLPNGTLLRTVFNGKNYHCLVEGDSLRFNGEPTSPSRFANAVGGTRRNAWRVIWVLFPNTTVWKLADRLRPKRARRESGWGTNKRQAGANRAVGTRR